MRCFQQLGAVLLLGTLATPALLAHNFWIEPTAFTPAPGQRVAVRLRVGQELQGDPVPRDPSLMKRFVTVGPNGAEVTVAVRLAEEAIEQRADGHRQQEEVRRLLQLRQ